jgi:hypothetical protein
VGAHSSYKGLTRHGEGEGILQVRHSTYIVLLMANMRGLGRKLTWTTGVPRYLQDISQVGSREGVARGQERLGEVPPGQEGKGVRGKVVGVDLDPFSVC